MRILVIRNEPPWPLCYGGRLHCYELCRRLAERHELLLMAQRPCEMTDWPFNFDCRVWGGGDRVEFRSHDPGPISISRVERFFGIDPAFVRHVLALARQWHPDVVVGMNYQSLACLARLPDFPTLCDLGDDETLHRLRELLHGRATRKWQDLKALAAITLFERQLLRKTGAVTVLSRADARFCHWHTGHPRIVCIPHGVDCDHYRPVRDGEDEDRVIFWGSLEFGPNISAILFFAEQVWPRILAARPQARWSIIGRGGSPLLEGVRRLTGVDFVGYVEDVRPHAARSAVAVVPMVSGAGIKNKIMEAWAMGMPVVCTPRALGDLPGIAGENVWVSSSPALLSEGVLTLMADRVLRRRMGDAARATALTLCSWDRASRSLEDLCLAMTKPGMSPVCERPTTFNAEVITHASA